MHNRATRIPRWNCGITGRPRLLYVYGTQTWLYERLLVYLVGGQVEFLGRVWGSPTPTVLGVIKMALTRVAINEASINLISYFTMENVQILGKTISPPSFLNFKNTGDTNI